jgi:hypothetical protein
MAYVENVFNSVVASCSSADTACCLHALATSLSPLHAQLKSHSQTTQNLGQAFANQAVAAVVEWLHKAMAKEVDEHLVLIAGQGVEVRGHREEEEGLHGVFKQLRRNGHQLIKGSCKQFNTDCHS